MQIRNMLEVPADLRAGTYSGNYARRQRRLYNKRRKAKEREQADKAALKRCRELQAAGIPAECKRFRKNESLTVVYPISYCEQVEELERAAM
jgi:hypothetical protein